MTAAVVIDPIASAPLWWMPSALSTRTATMPDGTVVDLSRRRVFPYDVNADTDSLRDRLIPDDLADPPAPLAGSPCAPGGQLAIAVRADPIVAVAGAPVTAVRFAVG